MTVTQPITGLAWHVHHNILVEWCYDYQERVDAIRRDKPLDEQALRLRLFQIVKGPLPPEYAAAYAEYATAWAQYDAAYDAAYYAAYTKLDDAKAEYAAAWAKYDAAYAEAKSQLLTLHAIECLDCPWNGKTIFPEGRTA